MTLSIALLVLIAMAALAVLLHGLLGPREAWDIDAGRGLLTRLGRRKERLLRVLKDIDEERQKGTLDPTEHARLRREYKREAIETMRELDRVRAAWVRRVARQTAVPTSLRQRIDKEVARRRKVIEKAKES